MLNSIQKVTKNRKSSAKAGLLIGIRSSRRISARGGWVFQSLGGGIANEWHRHPRSGTWTTGLVKSRTGKAWHLRSTECRLSYDESTASGYDPAVVPGHEEIITANGVIEVPGLKVVEIAVGEVRAQNVRVICHDIPELAGISGLLALSFLKHFRCVIDYREGHVEIQ